MFTAHFMATHLNVTIWFKSTYGRRLPENFEVRFLKNTGVNGCDISEKEEVSIFGAGS